MGMTIDDVIYFAECLKNNDTIDFNNMEPFCEAVTNTMHKYKKIKEYIQEPTRYGTMAEDCQKLEYVRKVIEDGNDD